MAGDTLPPRAHDCPRCNRSRLIAGRRHCTNPECTWVKCRCAATYDMHGEGSYHADDYKETPK